MGDEAEGVIPRLVTEDKYSEGPKTFVPKGSLVSVNIFNIQHREKYWKNAYEFDPDRLAEDGEGNNRATGENMAWLHFSSEGRQCFGMNFSLVEQRVILSFLCKLFTCSFCDAYFCPHVSSLVRKFTYTS